MSARATAPGGPFEPERTLVLVPRRTPGRRRPCHSCGALPDQAPTNHAPALVRARFTVKGEAQSLANRLQVKIVGKTVAGVDQLTKMN